MWSEIKRRWASLPQMPWTYILDTVNKQTKMPIGIQGSDGRWLVHPEHGLVYGCGESRHQALRNQAFAIRESRMDIEVLSRALQEACAGDEAKMEFLCNHAWKSVQQDLGILPNDQVYRERLS